MQFVFCTHVHFTTPDDVMTLLLFKFLCCCFYDKNEYSKCSKNLNTLFFFFFFFSFVFFFLQNAYKSSCSPRTYVVEVVPEHLYMAMMDSLRQQFYPRMRQAAETEKSLTAIERDIFVPCVRMVYHR